MDPVTLAGSFATIVGLVCNFRQERGATEALDHQKFIEWLEYHRHEEIKTLISNTAGLQAEVDSLLRADHALMLQKLDAINHTLATLLSHVAEFRGLAHVLVPSAEISDQAISIVKQLVNSGSGYFHRIKFIGGYSLQLENGGQIAHAEPRFLDDDLNSLVGLGLVDRDYGGSGSEIYRITRNAVRFVKALE